MEQPLVGMRIDRKNVKSFLTSFAIIEAIIRPAISAVFQNLIWVNDRVNKNTPARATWAISY